MTLKYSENEKKNTLPFETINRFAADSFDPNRFVGFGTSDRFEIRTNPFDKYILLHYRARSFRRIDVKIFASLRFDGNGLFRKIREFIYSYYTFRAPRVDDIPRTFFVEILKHITRYAINSEE